MYNNFKSTTVRGNFENADYADGSILANATFQRDVNVKNNLNLGEETSVTDSNTGITTYTDNGGNIQVKINGITYSISPTILSYLSTVSSNVQTQIDNFATSTSDFLTDASANEIFQTKVDTNIQNWSNIHNFNAGLNSSSVNAASYYLYSGTTNNFVPIDFSSFLTESKLNVPNRTWTETQNFAGVNALSFNSNAYYTGSPPTQIDFSSFVTSSSLTSALSSYLTSSTANSTFQTIGNYLTETALYNVDRTWSNTQNFQGVNATSFNSNAYYTGTPPVQINFASFLTASALTAYQTIADMASYVTNTSLSTTLSGYLTTSAASSIYLTKSEAETTYLSNATDVVFVNSTNTVNDGRGTYTIGHPLSKTYMILGGIQQVFLAASSTTTSSSGNEILIITDLSFYNQFNYLYGNIQKVDGTIVSSLPLSKNAVFRFLFYKGVYYQL